MMTAKEKGIQDALRKFGLEIPKNTLQPQKPALVNPMEREDYGALRGEAISHRLKNLNNQVPGTA